MLKLVLTKNWLELVMTGLDCLCQFRIQLIFLLNLTRIGTKQSKFILEFNLFRREYDSLCVYFHFTGKRNNTFNFAALIFQNWFQIQ